MALPADVTTGTWTLDNSHSEIGFTVRHAGISKVRGQFKEAEATLNLAENVADSKVNATIKTASFDSGDVNRDGHVKGEDFFDVEKNPTMRFVSTEVRGEGEEFTLVGELTIKGITRPVELEAEFGGQTVDAFGMTRAGFEAKGEISRKDFDITWNAPLQSAAGGVLVSDKVKIEIDASFVLPGEDAAQA